MPNRKLSGEAQLRSWAPSGTPITAPIRNGASLPGRIACRNFQAAQPCTIKPKVAMRTVDWPRGQEVQPNRRRDNRKRETGQPGDKGGGKGD